MADRGPLCTCGCYQSEHVAVVSSDWHWMWTECQTCSDCERFTASRDESDAEEAGVSPV